MTIDSSNVTAFFANLPAALWPIKTIEAKPGRLPESEWEVLRRFILKRDGYTCLKCGARYMQLDVDHILALAAGGTNHRTNLQTLCLKCHEAKHPWM